MMIVRKPVGLVILGYLCQMCHSMLQLQVDITKAVVCSDQAKEGDKVGLTNLYRDAHLHNFVMTLNVKFYKSGAVHECCHCWALAY